jgi:hypothetical protein
LPQAPRYLKNKNNFINDYMKNNHKIKNAAQAEMPMIANENNQ